MSARRSRRLKSSVAQACAALALCGGCASAPLRTPVAAPAPLPVDVTAYYAYPSGPRDVTMRLTRETSRYREWLVQFPFSAPAGFTPTEPTVELEWFESRQEGRRPAVLFNPILGGDYPLERGLCRFLASHGFHVALVHRKTLKISPEHPVEHLETLLRQGVLRIRQAVDWMAQQPGVDPDRMGSFGISMGGMASVMAAAVEPRLRVHVAALAGGSLPDILATTHDTLLTKPMARYLAAQGLDLVSLEARLRETVRTDPLRLAPYVDPSRVLLFVALADRTIGTANAQRLRRALRYPRTIFLPAGHYTSYLLLPYVRRESLRFLRRHLALQPPS
ncbi:MAG: alpha/beta hydrolase [Candidatus Omnitrophica bacterium]|nr:alpha/beta hydrolase [Candidatus Omnitrophota bacterium]